MTFDMFCLHLCWFTDFNQGQWIPLFHHQSFCLLFICIVYKYAGTKHPSAVQYIHHTTIYASPCYSTVMFRRDLLSFPLH